MSRMVAKHRKRRLLMVIFQELMLHGTVPFSFSYCYSHGRRCCVHSLPYAQSQVSTLMVICQSQLPSIFLLLLSIVFKVFLNYMSFSFILNQLDNSINDWSIYSISLNYYIYRVHEFGSHCKAKISTNMYDKLAIVLLDQPVVGG